MHIISAIVGLLRRKSLAWLLLAASLMTILFVVLWQHLPPGDPGGPMDDFWCAKVQRLPPQDRMRIVLDKLETLNPGFHKKPGAFDQPEVLKLEESTDHLRDIRPLGALPSLIVVTLAGSEAGKGSLVDLRLRNMKLIRLNLARNPDLKDLGPLKGMPLFNLNLADTAVESLEDLMADHSLVELSIARTSVTDLKPLRLMKNLGKLDCSGCSIGSFEPLAETKLEELHIDINWDRDMSALKRIRTLKLINHIDVKQFWKAPK